MLIRHTLEDNGLHARRLNIDCHVARGTEHKYKDMYAAFHTYGLSLVIFACCINEVLHENIIPHIAISRAVVAAIRRQLDLHADSYISRYVGLSRCPLRGFSNNSYVRLMNRRCSSKFIFRRTGSVIHFGWKFGNKDSGRRCIHYVSTRADCATVRGPPRPSWLPACPWPGLVGGGLTNTVEV